MSEDQSSENLPPVGLIAGQGRMPILEAQGMRAAGRKVACVGLAGQYDSALPDYCDFFAPVGLIRIGQWCRRLRKFGADEAVMIGRVRKSRMYDPMAIFRQMPDLRAAKLWYKVLRHDHRSQTLLAGVANEMEACGITMIDSTEYIPEHMADPGCMTDKQPSLKQQADIEFAWPILMRMNELEIGQAIAVKDREVIAVEAMEGTDRMISRAGAICKSGNWLLLKGPDAQKDMRFDVPTIGVKTIENIQKAGGVCVVVAAGKVILADKPEVIQTADRLGISIVGI
ncbi:LpxI family protein [Poriferisphaera sp. WC338]|uniref:LpxI family protein n=1 Tax=Poriferisphaera sp. WC338 TaxID=3425129 RepID=UPI003D819E10